MACVVKTVTKQKKQNDIFDIHADDYSLEIDKALNRYGANHDFFTSHKNDLILDVITHLGKSSADMTLMDVGCGVGKVHAHIKKSFKKVIGVDPSEQSIKVARQLHPEVEYKCYNGDILPAADNSVDMTLAICVFHHVPASQWQVFSKEMLRVLRPGGISLVIEHNPYNPLTRRIVNTCPLDIDAVLLSPRKLRSLFSAAGCGDFKSRTVLSVPPINSLLKKVDAALGYLPFGAQYYVIAHKSITAEQ